MALTIPEAFHDQPGGLDGPLVFAACYLVVRVLHLLLYWVGAVRWVGRGDAAMRAQVAKASIPMLTGTVLLFGAAFTHGVTQTALWALALAIDYGGILVIGSRGWVLPSPAHFAERHGLIIIIALGESIVSIGIGAAGAPISWPILGAAVLGVAIAAALWWLYFDVVAIAAEHVLTRLEGPARAALARDSYTFLHLPMVAGIILLSLGLKKVMGYVADPVEHSLTEPLKGVALIALFGGVLLYLLGHIGFRLRNMRSVNRPRVAAIVALLILGPAAAFVPALLALLILAVTLAALVLTELKLYAAARHKLRHHVEEST